MRSWRGAARQQPYNNRALGVGCRRVYDFNLEIANWLTPDTRHPILEGVMGEYMNEVTDQSFEQDVLKSDKPVLVDFWAEWCHPCKMLTPVVTEVAQKYEGKAIVVKLNVDDNNQTAQRYGIKGIPTLILFNGGNEAERVVGATSKDNISRMIDRALGV
jgi:thioredoxin